MTDLLSFALCLLSCVLSVSAAEVQLPRQIVSSCEDLRLALETPETVDIDIVRSFECDATAWNRTVVVRRDVRIQGRKKKGVLPHIDWGTSSKNIVAGTGVTVTFQDLIFLQQDMGIGSIDILFFKTAEHAVAEFNFVVVGVVSCPWKLNGTLFDAIDRTYPGKQESRQLNEETVEARDVFLQWPRRNSTWHLHHAVFTCNAFRKDPALMRFYEYAVQNSGHVQGDRTHGRRSRSLLPSEEDEAEGRDTGLLVVYVLVAVCAMSIGLWAYWFLLVWYDQKNYENWEFAEYDEEKGSRSGEGRDETGHHKSSPTPESWAILDSDVALEAPLGHGEFGKVYRGSWQGTTVAVKVIKHNDRCLQTNVGGPLEAFFAKHISHPNVVQTYQISKKMTASADSPAKFFGTPSEKKKEQTRGSQSGSCTSEDMFGSFDEEEKNPCVDGAFETWLIIEYCDRGSLSDAVASGIYQSPDRTSHYRMSFVARTALEIASAMNYLHSVRIIHGDLKTGNVLLKGDGSDPRGFICKVGDFGLSRFLAEDTHIKTFTCGTVTHMPPELLKGGVLTSAADVYSFAILLWELLSGRKPHEGKNQGEIVLAVVNNASRPAFPPNVPADFEELVKSCWQQNHLERPIFPDIIDKLSVLLQKYEKEEGLEEGARSSSHMADSHARSSFFSPHDSGNLAEKKKSFRLVPKKFNSLRVNPAATTAQASAFLDSNRSLHLSLDGHDHSDPEEAIITIQTSRSADGATCERGYSSAAAAAAALRPAYSTDLNKQ